MGQHSGLYRERTEKKRFFVAAQPQQQQQLLQLHQEGCTLQAAADLLVCSVVLFVPRSSFVPQKQIVQR